MDILLVRHGESEGNVNPAHYLEVADHRISLSELGMQQATDAGHFLAGWIDEHWAGKRIRVWNSPYTRTRQTRDGLLAELPDRWMQPRRWWQRGIYLDQREHPLLAEQQFGLFDGLEDEEAAERYPAEWEHYERCRRHEGKFWARLPLGESRFDVAVRVHQAFGTFHRDAEKHGIEHLIVVCHGTTLRAFAMMWLHWPFEVFEAEKNPPNTGVRYLSDRVDRGYIWPA